VVSPQEAVAGVRSGDHVFVGTACATPRVLIRALEDWETSVSDVQLVHFLTDGVVPVFKGGPVTRFKHKVFFVGTDTRDLIKEGKVDYIPVSISQVHRLIDTGRIPIDVAFIQVSPPDEEGQCSLGVSVDLIPAAFRRADKVIAEINPAMPRTLGDSGIGVEQIDSLDEVDTPVIEYLHPPADDVARKHVGDEGHIGKAAPGRNEGNISHPQLIGTISNKLALYQVCRALCGIVRNRGPT